MVNKNSSGLLFCSIIERFTFLETATCFTCFVVVKKNGVQYHLNAIWATCAFRLCGTFDAIIKIQKHVDRIVVLKGLATRPVWDIILTPPCQIDRGVHLILSQCDPVYIMLM